MERWRLFFASVLLLCFTSLSKKTVFSNLSHWEMGKRSDASAFYGSSPKNENIIIIYSLSCHFQTCMTFAKDHKRRYFEEWTLDAPFHEITMKRTGVFIKEAKASNNIHKSGRKTHALHSMPSDITPTALNEKQTELYFVIPLQWAVNCCNWKKNIYIYIFYNINKWT